MYELDKEKFGAFLVQMRKEKGMTQKELAEKLYVSDKAVSKWERGLSLPDISLLQPMAEFLGVTVTELLSGRIIEKDQTLTVQEVEPLVTGTLHMTEREQTAQREHRRTWGRRFLLAAVAFGVAVAALWRIDPRWIQDDFCVFFFLPSLMGGGFGAYFVFCAKEKLPAFYDQYKINFYSDDVVRMNFPGVYFNNRNWPHILNAVRAWGCLSLGAWGPVYGCIRWLLDYFQPSEQVITIIGTPIMLFVTLGGLFIPIMVVGKKYES